jgi:hypothetical protein
MSNVVRIDQPPANTHVPAGGNLTVNVYAKSSGKLEVDLTDGSFVGFSPGDNQEPLGGPGTADTYTCTVLAPSGPFRLYATVRFKHPGEMTIEHASDNKGPYYGDV